MVNFEQGNMNYRQVLPPEPLRKYVRYFWVLEANQLDGLERSFRVVPDGLPGLIFQEDRTSFVDKENQELPHVFLYGQTTRYAEHRAVKHFRNIGVYFQPTALKSLFGLDASDMTDRHIDINDLIKTDITEQLFDVATSEQRIKMLSLFLMRQSQNGNPNSDKMIFAAEQLQRGVSLHNVQRELNITERSFERYFKQHIGISGKLFGRVARFQSALEKIREDKFGRLTDIAYQSNYFDQSHFNREFREFAGASPKDYIAKAKEKVANFPEWQID